MRGSLTMEDNKELFGYLIIFSLMSTIVLGMSLLFFVMFHDYLYIGLYDVAVNLESSGVLGSWVSSFIDDFISDSTIVITALDFLWFGSFMYLISNIFIASYKMKRKGYLELFSYLTIGIMMFLFISSIFESITSYFYKIFFEGLLKNITISLPLFNFYISNFVMINIIIIVISLIINFVDFDFNKFYNRKNKESMNDEI